MFLEKKKTVPKFGSLLDKKIEQPGLKLNVLEQKYGLVFWFLAKIPQHS